MSYNEEKALLALSQLRERTPAEEKRFQQLLDVWDEEQSERDYCNWVASQDDRMY